MLDIKYVRENFEKVAENLERRKNPRYIEMLDEVKVLDEKWRSLKIDVDKLRSRRNKVSEEINLAKKNKKPADDLIKEAKDIPVKLEKKEAKMLEYHEKINSLLMRVPNLLHESVPYGGSDEDNVEISTFGTKPKFNFELKSHVDLLSELDLADLEKAAKISGSRWYFLKNELVILDMALQRYALDFMSKEGFTMTVPPFAVSRKTEASATSLDDFNEAIYKIKDEDLFLIPTSEHPLIGMWSDDVLDELPIKLAGLSTCFRKEAGAHGKDQKGIFRVHQFNKVEQVVICKPADSWEWHEKLLNLSCRFFESLGIHARVVNVCTGDLGIVASKKYDIEGWFPVQNAYRELGSCSNCTSYQAVRANIRYQDGKDRHWVHTLNNTCIATARVMVAILENFQTKDGEVIIPEVLHKYTGFKKISKK